MASCRDRRRLLLPFQASLCFCPRIYHGLSTVMFLFLEHAFHVKFGDQYFLERHVIGCHVKSPDHRAARTATKLALFLGWTDPTFIDFVTFECLDRITYGQGSTWKSTNHYIAVRSVLKRLIADSHAA